MAVREQYALTRFGGVLLYGLTASAIVLPAACYVGVMVNANYTALAAVLYTLPFLMIVVLFLTLLALRLARQKKPVSIMLSPWVGIPGYLTLFVLCFGPFAAGDYGVSAPGGPAETWLMTAALALTVLFMGMDTVLYRRALRRRPNDA